MADPLISGHNLSISLGGRTLFTGLGFTVAEGEKVGIIGTNGVGKSTLCKMIHGQLECDAGQISKRRGLKTGYLSQTPTVPQEKTLFQCLMEASPDPDDWVQMNLAQELFSKFKFAEAGLNENTLAGTLSGGWRKKLALAIEIMRSPNLLILDEPTNHLDVESILWLEDYLLESNLSYLAITHDRAFLDRISNVIWEIDPKNRASNGILRIEGNYADYCEAKDILTSALLSQEKRLSNTLRRETEWLRRGPKARSTKQNARIERAYELGDEVADLRDLNKSRKVGISFGTVDGTPKKLVDLVGVSKTFGDRTILNEFSLLIERGQKMGLIGANGAGKSTLIKLILGTEKPSSGKIVCADNLKVAYFDQNREGLDPKKTVFQSVCPEGEYVKFRGNFVHARGYLERFLFGPDDITKTISKLSGGEQARLLIARLMLIECNLLILDEPTNDLDIATLNVLAEELRDYPGALIIVSHDRFFLDQVADFHLALHNGEFTRFADIHQWERWMLKQGLEPQPVVTPKTKLPVVSAPKPEVAVSKKKLSFKEKQELESIEVQIAKSEKELANLESQSQSPEILGNPKKLKEVFEQLAACQNQIAKLFERWSELEK